jgi:excisionase family DNA binding protein
MTMMTQINDTNGIQPLTESQAAARLGLKVATLRAWRHKGKGPAYVRLGRAVRYLMTDVDDFIQSNRQIPRQGAEATKD